MSIQIPDDFEESGPATKSSIIVHKSVSKTVLPIAVLPIVMFYDCMSSGKVLDKKMIAIMVRSPTPLNMIIMATDCIPLSFPLR